MSAEIVMFFPVCINVYILQCFVVNFVTCDIRYNEFIAALLPDVVRYHCK